MISVKEARKRDYRYTVEWREAGSRRRKYFVSGKDAKEFAAALRGQLGDFAPNEVPPTVEERRAIAEARQHNIPLMEAIAHWRRTVGAAQGWTVSALVDSRLADAEKSHLSEVHARALRLKLQRAKDAIGGLPVSAVTPADLAPLIYAEQSHGAQKHTRAILSGLFTHGIRIGVLQINPAAHLRPQRRLGAAAPPEIFNIYAAQAWIQCVAMFAPSCLAGIAIGMFAGLRRSEVERLDWGEVKIDRGFIEVTAGKSKTKTRRLVDIMPNLAAILSGIPGRAGEVFPHSPRRSLKWARSAYGGDLPENGARHSFVSYHLAFFGDVAKTEMQAGHDRSILFQHYRELVTKADAEAYFDIAPIKA